MKRRVCTEQSPFYFFFKAEAAGISVNEVLYSIATVNHLDEQSLILLLPQRIHVENRQLREYKLSARYQIITPRCIVLLSAFKKRPYLEQRWSALVWKCASQQFSQELCHIEVRGPLL